MVLVSSISKFLIDNINLPPMFLRPIPLPKFLEEPILKAMLSSDGVEKRRRRAAKKTRIKDYTSSVMELKGRLERGTNSEFSVSGTDFIVRSNAWIVGDVKEGGQVRIKGRVNLEGVIEASSVVMLG